MDVIKKSDYNRLRYQTDPEFRERVKQHNKNWRDKNRDKIKEYNDKRQQNPNFREQVSKLGKVYRQKYPEKRKANYKNWAERNSEYLKNYKKNYEKNNKEKRRIWAKVEKCKRKRDLEFIILNDNPFDNSEIIDWHHIDNKYVIALPTDLHEMYGGKYHREFLVPIIIQIYGENQLWTL
jgi:hypothetical protein